MSSGAYLPTPAWRSGILRERGDFNRDGKPDLILQNISTGQRAIWLMNGVTVTSTVLPSERFPAVGYPESLGRSKSFTHRFATEAKADKASLP